MISRIFISKCICIIFFISLSAITLCQETPGIIYIKSNPSGAKVILDGKSEKKPTPFQLMLNPGSHKFRLELEEFIPFDSTINVISGKTIDINIKMLPLFGSIIINSNPAGAEIYIDEKPSGQITPYTISKIPSGIHYVELKKGPLRSNVQMVKIDKLKPEEVFLNLSQDFASISITTEPVGTIILNGEIKALGNYTGTLVPGKYNLEVIKEKYYPEKKELQLAKGDEIILPIQLKPITGNILILSDPPGGEIYLDGKFNGNSPKTITNVLIGKYFIEIKNIGYSSSTSEIEVKENLTSRVSSKLYKEINTEFTSKPDKAQLYFNGVLKGETPISITSPSGTYTIDLKKKFYKDSRNSFFLNTDSSINIDMEPLVDKLVITSNPPNALISINDVGMGKTPLTIQLNQGPYTIGLKKDGFVPLKKSLEANGTALQQNFDLKKQKNIGFAFFGSIIWPSLGSYYMGSTTGADQLGLVILYGGLTYGLLYGGIRNYSLASSLADTKAIKEKKTAGTLCFIGTGILELFNFVFLGNDIASYKRNIQLEMRTTYNQIYHAPGLIVAINF